METKKPSVREMSRQRELAVLRAIGLCGYLTTRLIALSVWRESTEHVARNKAQLMLVRMEKKGLVLKKAVASQSMEHVWILTQRNETLLLGRAGIRATLPNEHHDFDAIFFDLPGDSDPIYTGLIAVVDARPSLVERVVRVKKKMSGVSIEYVGDEQMISMLLKRVEQAML